jgi:hypothetical protein
MLPNLTRRQTLTLGAGLLAGLISLDSYSATADGSVDVAELSRAIPTVAPDEPGGPAVTSKGPHVLDVFVRGRHNHELVHRYWDGQKWSGWINLGGSLAAGPAVTSRAPHLLDVFVRGKDNDELVQRHWDGQKWSGWINLGGDLA